MTKTGKREVACVLVAAVMLHAGYITVAYPADQVGAYMKVTELFVWPVMAFLMAAFGLDWAHKCGLTPHKGDKKEDGTSAS